MLRRLWPSLNPWRRKRNSRNNLLHSNQNLYLSHRIQRLSHLSLLIKSHQYQSPMSQHLPKPRHNHKLKIQRLSKTHKLLLLYRNKILKLLQKPSQSQQLSRRRVTRRKMEYHFLIVSGRKRSLFTLVSIISSGMWARIIMYFTILNINLILIMNTTFRGDSKDMITRISTMTMKKQTISTLIITTLTTMIMTTTTLLIQNTITGSAMVTFFLTRNMTNIIEAMIMRKSLHTWPLNMSKISIKDITHTAHMREVMIMKKSLLISILNTSKTLMIFLQWVHMIEAMIMRRSLHTWPLNISKTSIKDITHTAHMREVMIMKKSLLI